jgi:hypothetical protein
VRPSTTTWLLADEYIDRGESARSADRPALKAILARIAEDRDVDAVVVHKIDRLARNMEDHVAIRVGGLALGGLRERRNGRGGGDRRGDPQPGGHGVGEVDRNLGDVVGVDVPGVGG